ncbi:MAG: twin-arginine translocase TatA/TatE family subunit [Gemmatimonadetes bacterium]|nr:twin-arginine translocase TatA/TatE family subunit [Gemmatimonadota bacterium]
MFGNLGGGEIVILVLIVLLVFGANRLPEAGKAVGKGIREFQRALRETQDEVERSDRAAPPTAPPRDAGPKRLLE